MFEEIIDWFIGTRRVWVELKKFNETEIIIRRLKVKPFGGLFVTYYDYIKEGVITLAANGGGYCPNDRPYMEVLRWAPLHHRKLRKKYNMALAMGEIDKQWGKG